jgi:uncharacterized membrane protein YccC
MILILFSFEITLFITRFVTHFLRYSDVSGIQIGTLHIHHLVPGILLLLISGVSGIGFPTVHRVNKISAVLFGVGAALTLDEFALWLNLKDVYWSKQGRESIDVLVGFSALLIILALVSISRRLPQWKRALDPFRKD